MTSSLRLELHGVGYAYGALPVLEAIDLAVEPGRTLAVIGPSGCGKSTLLGLLAGLLVPGVGEVRQEGTLADDCLAPVATIFQDFALLPWRTVAGNVALVLEGRLGRADRGVRVAESLAQTGLTAFADAWPRQLSGGMRQRVGIARALAVRPACLLMDEPLSALDAQTRSLLLEEFATLIARAGTTTVYVTHNLQEAVRLGDRILVLSPRPGRIRRLIDVAVPMPARDVTDPVLVALEQELRALLHDDA